MQTKTERMGQLATAAAKIETLLAQILPDTVVHPDTGWTVKDVLAHMTDWSWQLLQSGAAAAHGCEYRITPFVHEHHNWQVYRAALALPRHGVHAEWRASHATASAWVAGLSEEQWTQAVVAP